MSILLASLPTDVLRYICTSHLDDYDVFNLYGVSRGVKQAVTDMRYCIKRRVPLSIAIHMRRRYNDRTAVSLHHLSSASSSSSSHDVNVLAGYPVSISIEDEEIDTLEQFVALIPDTVKSIFFDLSYALFTSTLSLLPQHIESMEFQSRTLVILLHDMHPAPIRFPSSLTSLLHLPPVRLVIEERYEVHRGLKKIRFKQGSNLYKLIEIEESRITRLELQIDRDIHFLCLPRSLLYLKMNADEGLHSALPHLPSSIRTLIFGEYFDQPLTDVELPASLELIDFGVTWNQEANSIRFPPTLRTIIWSERFNRPINGMIFPPALTQFKFKTNAGFFSQHIQSIRFPPTLLCLELPRWFDAPIDNMEWPPLIETINLGMFFSKKLPVLPHSVKRLSFGSGQTIENISHALQHTSIDTLTIGNPSSAIGSMRDLILPSTITELTFSDVSLSFRDFHWPPNIIRVRLELERPLQGIRFPSSIKHIIIQRLHKGDLLDQKGWMPPEQLEHLSIILHPQSNHVIKLDRVMLPSSLSRLDISHIINLPSSFNWPSSLSVLDMFNCRLCEQAFAPGFLPASLREFVLPFNWNLSCTPMNLSLPENLLKFRIGDKIEKCSFSQPTMDLVAILPLSLYELSVFMRDRVFGNTPNSSVISQISSSSSSSSSSSPHLPSSLRILRLSHRRKMIVDDWQRVLHKDVSVWYD